MQLKRQTYKATHLRYEVDAWEAYFEPSYLLCKPPLSIDDDGADFFTGSRVPHQYSLEHRADTPFLAEVANARVASIQSLVFDRDNFYIDSYHNAMLMETVLPVKPPAVGKVQDGYVFADLDDNHQINVTESAILLASPHSDNYHHWLLETMPRLWLLQEHPELSGLPIIVPLLTRQFQVDTLNELLPYGSKICYIGPYILNVERLIFPSFLAPCGHSRRQLDWLRSAFLKRKGNPQKLIYISRRDAVNGRQLENEEEIVAYLTGVGFSAVTLNGIPHKAQVDLFTDAKVILGVSGSGITNHIFAPEGAHVIELHPANYTNRAHFFTSNLMNQTYQFVICDQQPSGDLYISIDRLKRVLGRVM